MSSLCYDHSRSPKWFAPPTPYAEYNNEIIKKLEPNRDNELNGIHEMKQILYKYDTYFPRCSVDPFAERY